MYVPVSSLLQLPRISSLTDSEDILLAAVRASNKLVLDEQHDLQRVVVVTFTEAAAGELRERVRERFVQARVGLQAGLAREPWEAPDEVLEDWVAAHLAAGTAHDVAERARRTLVAFDTACITTIHGFCARVLTEAAFEAGAPFATDMLGDADAVYQQVVDDFWQRLTWAAPVSTLESLGALGIRRKALLDLAKKAADPSLVVVPDDPGELEPVDLVAWRRGLQQARHAWATDRAGVEEHLLRSKAICRQRVRKKGLNQAISAYRAGKHLDELDAWLDREPVPARALPTAARECSRGFLAEATLPGHATPAHPLFDALQELCDQQRALGPMLAAWKLSLQHELVRATRERLAEVLRQRNALTFDELLRRVGGPLGDAGRRDALRDAVRRRYDAAVVDEFQDTDPVQWAIFRELFGDRLFLVGDPKQAIYSFRGADFGTYRRAASDCDEQPGLDMSFRSDEHLVEALHHLFAREAVVDPMFDPAIPFPKIEAHHEGTRLSGDDGAALQFRFLSRDGRAVYLRRWLTKRDTEDLLPSMVANDIVRTLGQGLVIRGKKGERTVGPGDCAVLTRKNEQARAVAHALLARGVPAVVRSDESVLKSDAFGDLLQVVRAVREPLRTVRVRRALLTSLMGYTAADLLRLVAAPDQWVEVAGRFRRWRDLWDAQGVLAMIRAVLDEGGVAERLLAQGDERALTNVRHLGELMQRAAVERRLSPDGLVAWLEEGAPGVDPDAAALRVESDAAAVQCVTVHSAKGLQYPLVWAPWLHSGSWVSQLDQEHLVVHDVNDPARRVLDLGSADHAVHMKRQRDEAFAEDLRLAYVALTRAEHRCTVYWGAGGTDCALAWVVHQRKWMKDRAQRRAKQIPNRFFWKKGVTKEENVPADLDALAEHAHISWDEADWADAERVVRWEPERSEAVELTAASVGDRRGPDRSWRRTSFTSFTRDVAPHDPRPHVDHDEDEGDHVGEAVPGDDPVPTHDIYGSARLGRVVHHVYEVAEPTADASTLAELLGAALPREGLSPAWKGPLADMVHDSLRTPLGDAGVCLADVPTAHRWAELDFHLPLRGGFEPVDGRLTPKRLAAAFEEAVGPGLDARWRDQLDRLQFGPARGFLVGSIDLVFCPEGRWFLADYKSNRLGPDWRDYRNDGLMEPMYASLYPLQYHLYAVALLRLLRARVPGFDAERDFGGVYYLFVRGMSPTRPGHGVFFDRPPVALLERLDAALGGMP